MVTVFIFEPVGVADLGLFGIGFFSGYVILVSVLVFLTPTEIRQQAVKLEILLVTFCFDIFIDVDIH